MFRFIPRNIDQTTDAWRQDTVFPILSYCTILTFLSSYYTTLGLFMQEQNKKAGKFPLFPTVLSALVFALLILVLILVLILILLVLLVLILLVFVLLAALVFRVLILHICFLFFFFRMRGHRIV